jgi:hypothetical protein
VQISGCSGPGSGPRSSQGERWAVTRNSSISAPPADRRRASAVLLVAHARCGAVEARAQPAVPRETGGVGRAASAAGTPGGRGRRPRRAAQQGGCLREEEVVGPPAESSTRCSCAPQRAQTEEAPRSSGASPRMLSVWHLEALGMWRTGVLVYLARTGARRRSRCPPLLGHRRLEEVLRDREARSPRALHRRSTGSRSSITKPAPSSSRARTSPMKRAVAAEREVLGQQERRVPGPPKLGEGRVELGRTRPDRHLVVLARTGGGRATRGARAPRSRHRRGGDGSHARDSISPREGSGRPFIGAACRRERAGLTDLDLVDSRVLLSLPGPKP